VPNYRAEYGILLEYGGTPRRGLLQELTSLQYAAKWVELIWQTARDLGYGRYFIQANGGNITDDHQPVIRGRNIPCVDIIYYDRIGTVFWQALAYVERYDGEY
jgi:hypothetical protein